LIERHTTCVRALVAVAAWALALWAAAITVTPAAAEAQEKSPAKDARLAERVVVKPGDSLWSISEGRLGPDATPHKIWSGVERIYALNRNRIGADPNLIFAGQRLLLPPAAAGSASEPSTAATPASGLTEPAEADVSPRTAKSAQERATRTAVGKDGGEGRQAPDPAGEPAPLPDAAAVAPVPSVGSLRVPDDLPNTPLAALVETFAEVRAEDGRRMTGWGIMALTLVVAALMAWKLPMKRPVADAKLWGMPRGNGGRAAYRLASPASFGPERRADPPVGGAYPKARGPRAAAGTARRRKAEATARKLALGVRASEVRCCPLRSRARSRAPMLGRKLRLRPGAARRPRHLEVGAGS
jgi:LysM domain